MDMADSTLSLTLAAKLAPIWWTGSFTLVTCSCRAWVSGSEKAGHEEDGLCLSQSVLTVASLVNRGPGFLAVHHKLLVAKSPAPGEVSELENKYPRALRSGANDSL